MYKIATKAATALAFIALCGMVIASAASIYTVYTHGVGNHNQHLDRCVIVFMVSAMILIGSAVIATIAENKKYRRY